MTVMSLRWMGWFLNIQLAIPFGPDDFGGPEHFRADGQTRGSGRAHIDAQPDSMLFGQKSNHPPRRKALGVANGQDRSPLQPVKDSLVRLGFGRTDEEDVTPHDLIDPVIAVN